MDSIKLLRAILPDVLIDNFDVVNFEKTDSRFDIYLDEKKVMMRDDKKSRSVISHGFGEYPFMSASASGLTRTLVRYSATTGICPSLTRRV